MQTFSTLLTKNLALVVPFLPSNYLIIIYFSTFSADPKLDVQEKINELEKNIKKEVAKLSKKNEKQASKIHALDIKLERSSAKLKVLRAKQEESEKRKK